MKKIKKILTKLSSFILVAVMLLGMLPAFTENASANSGSRPRKKYEIAIVYDNSTSMFGEGDSSYSKYWCRAKYAMEIFASMLDYTAGDRLTIFPMWEVTTDGSLTETGKVTPVKIENANDISKITNMATVHLGSTPFVPALEARDYLRSVPSDREKWLIFMTDGEINTQDDRVTRIPPLSSSELKARMLEVASNDITVQYIGFGAASRLEDDPANHFYGMKSTDTSLKDDLIKVCNMIFERDELPKNGRLSGTSLKLDLSMKKIIVFVQGANAKIESLTGPSGNTIPVVLSPGQRTFSQVMGHTALGNWGQVDNTLAGQVVTFGACSKGNYTLNYTGDESAVQIFYEPDVELQVTLESVEDGTVFTEASEAMTAGEYIIRTAIVDAQTGEDVTEHPLMGNSSLKTTITTEKNGSKTNSGREVKVNFDPDDPVNILVEGEYLNGYKITTDGDNRFSWLWGLTVQAPAVDLVIKAEQESSTYRLKEYQSWKPIKVTLTIDGLVPTDDQMARTALTLRSATGAPVRYEKAPGEAAFLVYVGYDESGSYVQPALGDHELEIMVTHTDEFGKKTSKKKDLDFTVEAFSFGMSASVQQDDSWYLLKEHEEWKPIRVDVQIDDGPMTPEQLANVTLTLNGKKEIAYYYEPIEGESAFNLYIGYKDANTYVEPEQDEYEFTVSAVYNDVSGISAEKTDDVEFEVNSMSRLMIILIWVFSILLLIILWLMYMLRKVLPKEIKKDKATYWCLSAGDLGANVVDFKYSRKGKSIVVSGPKNIPFSEQCSVTLTVRAIDNHFTPKKDRRCEVINIQSNCSKVRLGGTEFVKVKNAWVKKAQARAAEQGKAIPPINYPLSPNPDIKLVADPNGFDEGKLTCKAKTRK